MDHPTAAHDTVAPARPLPELLEPGQIIAERYRVEALLGRGAFGRVYRATHTMMKTQVAIKTLVGDLHDQQEARARFQREAQAAGAIDHPHVCRVTDFGELRDGSFFMVMEFLDGRTLEQEIQRRGVLRAEESIEILVQVCRALERAHEMGIVHRDLKPENIMLLAREGNPAYVKILDFGIAFAQPSEKVNFSTEKLTRVGTVCGTPHYMSPEQVVGDDIDHRSDLYSLGIIFFEMLSGRVPFQSDKLTALMMMQLTERPPDLDQVAPSPVPPAVKAIVERLMDKEPASRFQSAAALREALIAARAALPHFDPVSFATATSMSSLSQELPLKQPGASPTAWATPAAPKAPGQPSATFARLDALKHKLPPALASLPTSALVFVAAGLAGSILLLLVVLIALATSGSPSSSSPLASSASPPKAADVAPALAKAPEQDPEARQLQHKLQLDLEGSRLQFKKDPKISLVLEELIVGNLDAGLERLHALEPDYGEHAHFHYFKGAALARQKRWDEAASSYARAMTLDLRYAGDKDVLAHLGECFEAKSCEAGLQAVAASLDADPKTQAIWLNLLTQKTLDVKAKQGQRKAAKLLLAHPQAAQQEPWLIAAAKLALASSCKERVALIEQLGQAKQERALPALRQLSRLPTRGCGFLKREDCHKCLRAPLRKAIASIKKTSGGELTADEAGEDAAEEGGEEGSSP